MSNSGFLLLRVPFSGLPSALSYIYAKWSREALEEQTAAEPWLHSRVSNLRRDSGRGTAGRAEGSSGLGGSVLTHIPAWRMLKMSQSKKQSRGRDSRWRGDI